MTWKDFRRRAAKVRDVPLETVLALRGAKRDRRDRRKWHTEQGPVSVTGQQFMNWRGGTGGGGAIDLVMHLVDVDVRTAVAWLEKHATVAATSSSNTQRAASTSRRHRPHVLRLPVRDNGKLRQVREYLIGRSLPSPVLDQLVEAGRLYADGRGNAVFILVAGKANQPVGAELRGTGAASWRGMAPGTEKDRGYFWIGEKGTRRVVVCESAIDAISCFVLHPDHVCVSTAGARPDPLWLPALLRCGCEVACGFDADPAGDAAAREMTRRYAAIKRLRPVAKDWNAALTASK